MTGGKEEEQSDQEDKEEQANKGEKRLEKDGYDDKYLETCQGSMWVKGDDRRWPNALYMEHTERLRKREKGAE